MMIEAAIATAQASVTLTAIEPSSLRQSTMARGGAAKQDDLAGRNLATCEFEQM
jgi:hypothetical protein